LCRDILRPPVAETRLQRLTDGRVLLTLKGAWSDGTTHVLFSPIELLEKLAALIPRPRINLVLYHGLFAPHAAGRRAAVRRQDAGAPGSGDLGAPPLTPEIPVPPNPSLVDAPAPAAGIPPPESRAPATPRYWTWATLMRLIFALDALACPRCGGRMVLLATIEDPRIVGRIVGHLGLPTDVPQPRPARSPPAARDLFGDTAD
jgi:hypothetical protein